MLKNELKIYFIHIPFIHTHCIATYAKNLRHTFPVGFETFESLYLPHLIVAVAGQVRARGNVVILGLSPHGLLAVTRYTRSRITHRTKSDFSAR